MKQVIARILILFCIFLAVSPEYFAAVIDLLNHRPRKRLGWCTPFEVFFGVALA